MPPFRSAQVQYDDFYAMLSDSVRMNAFGRAIASTVKQGDVVVDLGAGTGILGFLAVKAGADKVFAIEKSDAIELARAVAERNGMTDRFVFLNENSKDVSLPVRADVIVSETLGSFGIDENTLAFMLDARDRFLKPGGVLLPKGLTLSLAPANAPECQHKLEFWREVQGIDFSPALEVFSKKIMIEPIEPRQLLSEPQVFSRIDLHDQSDTSCEGTVRFTMTTKGTVHGFAGWFELALTDEVGLSTAPGKRETHWKQAFFPILDPFDMVPGDILELRMSVGPKSGEGDDTVISYQYRGTQLAALRESGSGKVGRNDPCACGSGLKYKRCCGGKGN